MPTNNPKVSAYIPRHIFDCFKAFYESRDISMSQAVAIVFAEYFGVDYQVDQNSKLPSGLVLSRLLSLEDKVDNLFNLVGSLSERTSKPHLDIRLLPEASTLENSLDAVTQSSSQSELLTKRAEKEPGCEVKTAEEIIINDKLTHSFEPLSALQLSERLKVDRSLISRYKNGDRKQSLAEWSKTLDPDGIAWEYSKERKEYIPSTYSEPQSNLVGGLS